MKPGLAVIAIVLSLVAIVLSVGVPAYNFITAPTGVPDFSLASYEVDEMKTVLRIRNNGTATAHNIQVVLDYRVAQISLPHWGETEFISEIEPGTDIPDDVAIVLPIGTYQLTSGVPSSLWELIGDSAVYSGLVLIYCKEVPRDSRSLFGFNVTITRP